MAQLRCGELQHVLPATKEGSPGLVINAGLGLVEALKGTLLASQLLAIFRLDSHERLEEACVAESGIDGNCFREEKTDAKR